ncbi:hypothetical protein PCANC_07687 [Puccinia coronata f. sp. avenae]|uniref:CBM21 domain-containing protein n=1 Tax=Puccinia coronata f. sp. avenae TaxID=200324 RepID=A0A2N5V231_9BASI|nr:hypothetical protein PCASD_04855 [Puccinia coronata f. sp. avenae]PLW52561.1 hypothetical protein PCANC_07687 [Puccinia coronata f. sp. avenae]
MTSLQTQPPLPSTTASSTTPPSHQQQQPTTAAPPPPPPGFMHQKSYSAYQFPIVNFNSPTPPSSDRKDYFDPPLDSKKMGRPLHQKAQSETCMRLDLPGPGAYSSSACTSASSSSCSFDTTPMLRKKSGEVVRSSLKFTSSSGSTACSSRSNSYSNSRSAPSTPTQGGAKAVHFDTHLEHVRHFLSQQRPIAVSRDGSPIETETEGEEEYPFPDMMNHAPGSLHHQRSKLVIELPNMPLNPALSIDRHVCLNSLELAADGKNLKGTVLVHNLSFEKRVAVRFTFDKWQTVSEVTADYLRSQTPHHHIHKFPPSSSHHHHPSTDVFGFTIKLQDVLARIEEREMEIAVRYLAAGGEYWDNNFSQNYHVRFKNLRNGPPHGSAHQQKPTSQSPMSRSPTITTTTGSIPNTNHHHHHREANEDASWATTLRAELDRLVGDDLGVSSSMMNGAHGIVGLKKKKGGSASFSCVGNTHPTLDALSAGSQLRSGTGLSARYDFGLSLKQAVRQQHAKGPNNPNSNNNNNRFHNNVLPLTLSPVPVEWLGLQPTNNNHCASFKLNDRSPEFLNQPSYTPPNSNSQHHPHQPQPPPPQYHGSQLYHAYTKRWSLPTSTPIALPNLPPSPPQDLPSSSASSTSSTTTTVRNLASHDSSPSLPISSNPTHCDNVAAAAAAAALPPHQPPSPFFSSGIFTPQSPSLTDDSI